MSLSEIVVCARAPYALIKGALCLTATGDNFTIRFFVESDDETMVFHTAIPTPFSYS